MHRIDDSENEREYRKTIYLDKERAERTVRDVGEEEEIAAEKYREDGTTHVGRVQVSLRQLAGDEGFFGAKAAAEHDRNQHCHRADEIHLDGTHRDPQIGIGGFAPEG